MNYCPLAFRSLQESEKCSFGILNGNYFITVAFLFLLVVGLRSRLHRSNLQLRSNKRRRLRLLRGATTGHDGGGSANPRVIKQHITVFPCLQRNVCDIVIADGAITKIGQYQQ